jgi:hypothetical protein
MWNLLCLCEAVFLNPKEFKVRGYHSSPLDLEILSPPFMKQVMTCYDFKIRDWSPKYLKHSIHEICKATNYIVWGWEPGEITPSYILHTRAFGTYLLGGGGIYLAKKIIRWWYFTCRKPKNIICDGILHVNMFHYFKTPYFTCNFSTKFTYNEYIGPYFFIAVVLRFLPSDLPGVERPSWPRMQPQHPPYWTTR